MVNENVFQVGCHMMPYVIQTGRIMMGTRGKKRGKKHQQHEYDRRTVLENVTTSRYTHWHTHTHTVKVLIREEEGLHAVKRLTPWTILALASITLTAPFSISISTSFCFHIRLSHSLFLIKYSQLVPLNIHHTALLRLSGLCQSACSGAPEAHQKPEN